MANEPGPLSFEEKIYLKDLPMNDTILATSPTHEIHQGDNKYYTWVEKV